MANRKLQVSAGQRGVAVNSGRLVVDEGDVFVVTETEYANLASLISDGTLVDLGGTSDPLTPDTTPGSAATVDTSGLEQRIEELETRADALEAQVDALTPAAFNIVGAGGGTGFNSGLTNYAIPGHTAGDIMVAVTHGPSDYTITNTGWTLAWQSTTPTKRLYVKIAPDAAETTFTVNNAGVDGGSVSLGVWRGPTSWELSGVTPSGAAVPSVNPIGEAGVVYAAWGTNVASPPVITPPEGITERTQQTGAFARTFLGQGPATEDLLSGTFTNAAAVAALALL